jgi:hypothetical protein
MSDFQKRLSAKRELTPPPGGGFNVVGVDTFEDPGDDLYLIGSVPTRELAERLRKQHLKDNPGATVHIYGSEES